MYFGLYNVFNTILYFDTMIMNQGYISVSKNDESESDDYFNVYGGKYTWT